MNLKLTRITKFLLDFMYFAGMLVCLTLPFTFKWYGSCNNLFVIFFLSGVLAILLIGELRKMFDTVLADNCFVRENVKSLHKMGTYSFLIALLTAFRLFLYLTPAVLIIILVFVVAGLFSKVLAGVFDRAVSYKEENDLTI